MEFEGQYLTYLEYKDLVDSLGGSPIEEMPFNLLEFRTRKEIDDRTYSRLKNLSTQLQEVKLCEYEMINRIKGYLNGEINANIKSESTDGYSVSYASIDEIVKSHKVEITNLIDTYLSECKLENGIPYLYRG